MKGLVAVVLLLVPAVCRASHPKPACRYPPSMWCHSLEIATACGVQKQCMEKEAIREDPRAPKVNVSLYYESLCPASVSYLLKQLLPTYMMLEEIMEIHLVPFGNAKMTADPDAPFTCQHGPDECKLNMIEACVLHHLRDSPFQYTAIYCIYASANIKEAPKLCFHLDSFYESWDAIIECVNGAEGFKLMTKNANDTRAEGIAYVPWVTVDGVHPFEEKEAQVYLSLFMFVCEHYKGKKPAACTNAEVHMKGGYSFA